MCLGISILVFSSSLLLSLSSSSALSYCVPTCFQLQIIILQSSGSSRIITPSHYLPHYHHPKSRPRRRTPFSFHFSHESYIMPVVTRSQAYQGPITRSRTQASRKFSLLPYFHSTKPHHLKQRFAEAGSGHLPDSYSQVRSRHVIHKA